jgi:ABC-type amino acid transport substrate-binding protein
MFCTPHLSMDLVLVSRGALGSERRRAALQGMRLATLTTLAAALADRGALARLPAVAPVATPWLLVNHLLEGGLDGIIVTNVMARAVIRHFPEAGLRVQFVLATSVFAGAVAYGAHDLLRAINTILDELQQDGSLATLFRQETGLPLSRPYPN